MIGQIISHYRIIEKLGEGGMGVVYKAQDLKLDRFVALKFLPPHLTTSEEEKQRFIHEAKAASALDHQNICTIHEINDTDDGKTYIVMACYEGQTLKQLIQNRPLKIDESIRIITQISQGLSKAHRKGIIHRDIKPANIIIDEDDTAKILDFGLAKLSGQTVLTKIGTTMGTVKYMSPEQTSGDLVDQRSDIWSLGVLFYEMLTGQLPFKGDYEQAIIYSIMNEEPQTPSSISSEITPELELIINKVLTKDLDERYQQIDELIEDLKSFSEGATPEGIRIKSKKSKISHPLIYGISALVIILAIFVVLMLFNGKAGSIKTIAVLPLENLTGDPDQEYFCDGMTDALIGELVQINALRVISRHSAMKYKNTDKSIKEIAEELNVDAIVDASFLRSGTLIRINANLIDAKEDQHLWAQQFEHEIKDILRLYSEVARTITGEIKIKLSLEEEKRLTTTQQVNPEAYDHYLMARFYYNNFQWLKAKDEFEHAIKIDTTYAGAYAGLAYCYVGLVHFGFLERVDVISHAKRAGLKAIVLDSTSVEALVALGSIFNFLDWNFAEAGKHLSKAVDLNPNSAFANDMYGSYLIIMGRFDEAIKVRRHYRELDPLTIKSNFGLGWAYWYSGQFETAISHFKKTLEIDSTSIYANSFLALSYSHLGMHDKALSIVREQRLEEKPYPAVDIAAQIYARAGQDSNAINLIDKMTEPIHMYDLALVYSILGQKDNAFEWLENCYQIHHTNLPGLKVEPDFEHIRSDPRYDDLIVRIGFP